MKQLAEILGGWNPGEVHGLAWLKARGMTSMQAYRHFKEGNLQRIGSGIYARPLDKLKWAGAVSAMQWEFRLPFHVAGQSSLELRGSSHNIRMARPEITLVTYKNRNLPAWVLSNDWGVDFKLNRSKIFSGDVWLEEINIAGMTIAVSSRELAILEVINETTFDQSFEAMENLLLGLMTMRWEILQKLLEGCTSVKVKRVFLYLSEKLSMPYFERIDQSCIDLGKGPREVIRGGKMAEKYLITVPLEAEESQF